MLIDSHIYIFIKSLTCLFNFHNYLISIDISHTRHEWFGKSYVPLKWSNTLKAEAQKWAVHLANSNKFYHDSNRGNRGENLAWNGGGGVTTESVLYSECYNKMMICLQHMF